MLIESLVFGLGYKMRSGKDTVAMMLKAVRGSDALTRLRKTGESTWLAEAAIGVQNRYDIRIYHFADALKKEVNNAAMAAGGMQNLFGDGCSEWMQENGNFVSLPSWVQYDPAAPMDDPACPLGKQRLLLQWYGSEFRRSANHEYWVHRLAEQIAKDKPEIAVIPDMRFENEMRWCEKYGSTIKVHKPGLSSGFPTHVSETALDHIPDEEWDAIVLNDGDLEQLQERTLLIFDSIMEKRR